MEYRTFDPCVELSSFVKCFWTLAYSKEPQPQKQRIVPDGCMEMIFHGGDLYKQYLTDGSTIIQPRCFVFGQITSPLDIEPTGDTSIFAVRFLQDGFTPFATIDINRMENRAVPLVELFGDDGFALQERILEAKKNEDRIALCEEFFLTRSANTDTINQSIRSCVEIILRLKGNLSVEQLSEEVKVSRRQLERRFSASVGMSPKQLSRIIRLQASLKKLYNNEFSSLTEIAYEGMYHDQSHFIKDFKEFTGVTPKLFFADSLKMSSLFYRAE